MVEVFEFDFQGVDVTIRLPADLPLCESIGLSFELQPSLERNKAIAWVCR